MASASLPRNGHADQFDHVIGIDIHRKMHIAFALAPNRGKLVEPTFPARSKAYE
jgi:hypothetical protein